MFGMNGPGLILRSFSSLHILVKFENDTVEHVLFTLQNMFSDCLSQ